MLYLGDYEVTDDVDFKFSTHEADGTPATLSGSPDVAVYRGNDAGNEISDADVVLTADFDSVTGLNHVRIDLTNSTEFWEGGEYQVVISAGTVDSISVVGTVLAHFSIIRRVDLTTADLLAQAKQALVDYKLDHLIAVAESDDPVDNSIIAKLVSTSVTADWSNFNNTTMSLRAIKEENDATQASVAALADFDPATATVNGVTWDDMMDAMMAVMFGVASVSGSTVTFKRRDGSTTKVTIGYGTTDGERLTSVIA